MTIPNEDAEMSDAPSPRSSSPPPSAPKQEPAPHNTYTHGDGGGDVVGSTAASASAQPTQAPASLRVAGCESEPGLNGTYALAGRWVVRLADAT